MDDDATEVSMPRDVFNALIANSEILGALLAAGVENWEGYRDAVAAAGESVKSA